MMTAPRLLASLVLAVALGYGLPAEAAPEPKVAVEFAVTNGDQLLVAPATVALSAEAFARQQSHPIVKVEFYNGATLIATATSLPYQAAWGQVPAGTYSLSAKAINDKGESASSPPISVFVDAPPSVALTAPTANTVVTAPASLTLAANASDADGSIAKVEFYQGATLIGTATAAPYTVGWTTAVAGSYTLTAVATDDKGATTTSAAIPLLVNAPPQIVLGSPAPSTIVSAPGSLTLTANATDSDGTIAQVAFYNGTTLLGTATSAPYSVSWNNIAAGSYSLTAQATDNLGASTTSVPVSVIVNALPTVTLTSPTPNQILAAPATVTLTANAGDTDGSIAKVEFYQGATLLGTAASAPYNLAWNNVGPGSYSLTAVAIDDRGGQVTSVPVAVMVDAPPTVSLTSPSAGAVGIAPASFTLTANAADSDGTIAKVEFFSGTTLLGTATAAPYSFNWNAIAPGNYSLTAKATDDLGIATTSSPVAISVIVNSPPTISLTSPTANQGFKAPATVSLTAEAADPDNNLAKVEFFQNGTLIATALTPPYAASWANVQQGTYTLTAVATDAVGAQTTSSPVAISVSPAQAGVYYLHTDHLNTPRLVTDEANTVVWRHLPTTEPFGNSPVEEDPNATGNRFELPLAFPGQYRDKETGLFYNFYRDYDPNTGRYVQSDPIGLDGGINTYSYVKANPARFVDILGLRVTLHERPISNSWVSGIPGVGHTWLELEPDNPEQVSCLLRKHEINGVPFPITLSAFNEDNLLSKAVGRRGRETEGTARGSIDLDPPGGPKKDCECGQVSADSQFIVDLILRFNGYQNNLPYSPAPGAGSSTYNSNGFTNGLLGAAGYGGPIPPQFGGNNPVPASSFGK